MKEICFLVFLFLSPSGILNAHIISVLYDNQNGDAVVAMQTDREDADF